MNWEELLAGLYDQSETRINGLNADIESKKSEYDGLDEVTREEKYEGLGSGLLPFLGAWVGGGFDSEAAIRGLGYGAASIEGTFNNLDLKEKEKKLRLATDVTTLTAQLKDATDMSQALSLEKLKTVEQNDRDLRLGMVPGTSAFNDKEAAQASGRGAAMVGPEILNNIGSRFKTNFTTAQPVSVGNFLNDANSNALREDDIGRLKFQQGSKEYLANVAGNFVVLPGGMGDPKSAQEIRDKSANIAKIDQLFGEIQKVLRDGDNYQGLFGKKGSVNMGEVERLGALYDVATNELRSMTASGGALTPQELKIMIDFLPQLATVGFGGVTAAVSDKLRGVDPIQKLEASRLALVSNLNTEALARRYVNPFASYSDEQRKQFNIPAAPDLMDYYQKTIQAPTLVDYGSTKNYGATAAPSTPTPPTPPGAAEEMITVTDSKGNERRVPMSIAKAKGWL